MQHVVAGFNWCGVRGAGCGARAYITVISTTGISEFMLHEIRRISTYYIYRPTIIYCIVNIGANCWRHWRQQLAPLAPIIGANLGANDQHSKLTRFSNIGANGANLGQWRQSLAPRLALARSRTRHFETPLLIIHLLIKYEIFFHDS